MGWYHVYHSGKGMFLGESRDIKFVPEVFCDYYSKKTGKECSFLQALRLINEDYPKWYVDETSSDKRFLVYANELCSLVLHEIFEERYGYPQNSFFSISDYDFTVMLFCNAKWPPEKYNKALAELTEAKLKKQLQEFLSEVTGNEKFKTKELEFCEEYIKE